MRNLCAVNFDRIVHSFMLLALVFFSLCDEVWKVNMICGSGNSDCDDIIYAVENWEEATEDWGFDPRRVYVGAVKTSLEDISEQLALIKEGYIVQIAPGAGPITIDLSKIKIPATLWIDNTDGGQPKVTIKSDGNNLVDFIWFRNVAVTVSGNCNVPAYHLGGSVFETSADASRLTASYAIVTAEQLAVDEDPGIKAGDIGILVNTGNLLDGSGKFLPYVHVTFQSDGWVIERYENGFDSAAYDTNTVQKSRISGDASILFLYEYARESSVDVVVHVRFSVAAGGASILENGLNVSVQDLSFLNYKGSKIDEVYGMEIYNHIPLVVDFDDSWDGVETKLDLILEALSLDDIITDGSWSSSVSGNGAVLAQSGSIPSNVNIIKKATVDRPVGAGAPNSDTSDDPTEPPDEGMNTGTIIAIAVSCTVVITTIVIVIVVLVIKRKGKGASTG